MVNVQRGGPSTGLPTKTEQADLLQAMFGRNGESPIPIVAPATPSDCFGMALEAAALAVRAMTPVFLLSEGFLANSAEPWQAPRAEEIPEIEVKHPEGHRNGNGAFLPYARDAETLARPWALPGTPGLEHRLGGLSKAPVTGNVSYDPEHNEQMIRERAQKVARLADVIPEQDVFGAEDAELLMVSWGGTFGVVRSAVAAAQRAGKSVAHAHVRYPESVPAQFGRGPQAAPQGSRAGAEQRSAGVSVAGQIWGGGRDVCEPFGPTAQDRGGAGRNQFSIGESIDEYSSG